MCYERSGILSIDQVLGNPWNSSARYQTFRRSLRCIECGLLGLYFACERSKYQDTTKYHYNLYGIGPNGKEVILTKDHIIPKSRGGRNTVDNMQTMCKPCNERKGNRLPWENPYDRDKMNASMPFLAHTTTAYTSSL